MEERGFPGPWEDRSTRAKEAMSANSPVGQTSTETVKISSLLQQYSAQREPKLQSDETNVAMDTSARLKDAQSTALHFGDQKKGKASGYKRDYARAGKHELVSNRVASAPSPSNLPVPGQTERTYPGYALGVDAPTAAAEYNLVDELRYRPQQQQQHQQQPPVLQLYYGSEQSDGSGITGYRPNATMRSVIAGDPIHYVQHQPTMSSMMSSYHAPPVISTSFPPNAVSHFQPTQSAALTRFHSIAPMSQPFAPPMAATLYPRVSDAYYQQSNVFSGQPQWTYVGQQQGGVPNLGRGGQRDSYDEIYVDVRDSTRGGMPAPPPSAEVHMPGSWTRRGNLDSQAQYSPTGHPLDQPPPSPSPRWDAHSGNSDTR